MLLSALLATLLLSLWASAAHAEGPTEQWASESQETGGTPQENGGGAPEAHETGGETPEQGLGTGEQPAGTGEGPAQAPESGEEPQGEGAQAPAEKPVETPPVETPPGETQTPPSEPVNQTPPPSETGEPAPVKATGPEGETQATGPAAKSEEQPPSKATGSQVEEAGAPIASSTHATTEVSPAASDTHPSGLEAASALAVAAAPVAAQAAQVSAERETAQTSTQERAVAAASRQAGRFSCEFSALGGNMTDNCTAGWLTSSAPANVAVPTTAAVAEVTSLAPPAPERNSPAGDDHNGFVVSGPPLTPAPGPAPSGASGGAGGAAGGGAGTSTFLTLAALLLAAPRAMRRLWLSFEPWLAGCFVLIPERPD